MTTMFTVLLTVLVGACATVAPEPEPAPSLHYECDSMRLASNAEVEACKAFCIVGDDACARENCFVRAILLWKGRRRRCEPYFPVLYYPNPTWPTVGKMSKDDEEF